MLPAWLTNEETKNNKSKHRKKMAKNTKSKPKSKKKLN